MNNDYNKTMYACFWSRSISGCSCWWHVCVVLLSTLFFHFVEIANWRVMAVLWALVPIANMIAFMRVPIPELLAEGEKGMLLG